MKKLFATTTLAAALLIGGMHTSVYWVQAKPLPHQNDEAASLAGYYNYMHGPFPCTATGSYTLHMEWEGSDSLQMYFAGENGHWQVFTVQNGVPHSLTVPQDGLYRFQMPLEDSGLTGFTFHFYAGE